MKQINLMAQSNNILEFQFTFCATKGRTWPCVHFLSNDNKITTAEVIDKPVNVNLNLDSNNNNISIDYFNKREWETIIEQGKIVQDQSLELVSVHVDGILLDSWFWTDGVYHPNYFKGFLDQVPDAPTEIKSQLIWHFPGVFVINNVPGGNMFWDWYQQQRTIRIKEGLVDPTGQLNENLNPMDNESKALISKIKQLINV